MRYQSSEEKYVKPLGLLLGPSPDFGYPAVESITPRAYIHQREMRKTMDGCKRKANNSSWKLVRL